MVVGGKRKGSGRPKGTSKYKEETKAIRIPLTLVPYINIFLNDYSVIGSKMVFSNYDIFYPRT